MTNIVITMAGRGSRFSAVGFNTPKYAIEAHGRTLFEWSLISLREFIHADDRVIFACLQENESDSFITHSCSKLGITNFRIVNLEKLTDGQATTAYLTRHEWSPQESVLIYNIDTFVNPAYLKPSFIRPGSDGWVPCFQAGGDHWSFIKVDEKGWAIDAAEKVRISPHASVGLYWFSDTQIFCDAYTRFYQDDRDHEEANCEKYVAPLYQYLIRQNRKVSISDIPLNEVHVLGTPDELITFQKSAPPNIN